MNEIQYNIDRLDWNLLRVFEVMFRERQNTRAADVLALTPSAVSHAVRRLREHLGDPLFLRQGNAMVPTPACERLAPALLEQINRLRQLLQQWSQFDAGTTRQTFRIGMPEAVEMVLLPTILKAFKASAPLAALTCASFDRGNASRLLASGQLDAVIDVAQPVRSPVHQCRLMEDAFCAAVGPGKNWRRSPTIKQYLGSRHIAVSGRSTGNVLEDAALLTRGIERQIALRCQNYASALQVLSESDYVLTAPAHLIGELSRDMRIRRWKLPFDMPEVRLNLYWHENNDTDAASGWLRQSLTEAVKGRFNPRGHGAARR